MRAASSLVAITALVLSVHPGPASAVALDPPDLQANTADRIYVTLSVRAGESGAPGGFVVEYMRADRYRELGGWPDVLSSGALQCTFTGSPTLTVTPGLVSFRLVPWQSASVVIGKLFDETGLVAEDPEELAEGTEYVFRARALAAPGFEASAYSATVGSTTTNRTSTNCTVTLGYWKRHPDHWASVTSMKLGDVSYGNSQLEWILLTPARGNGLVSLAHQLIAAKLNQLLGVTPPPEVVSAIQQADAVIGSLVVPPVGQGWVRPSLITNLVLVLDQFNAGRRGPQHCPDSVNPVRATPPTWGSVKVRYR